LSDAAPAAACVSPAIEAAFAVLSSSLVLRSKVVLRFLGIGGRLNAAWGSALLIMDIAMLPCGGLIVGGGRSRWVGVVVAQAVLSGLSGGWGVSRRSGRGLGRGGWRGSSGRGSGLSGRGWSGRGRSATAGGILGWGRESLNGQKASEDSDGNRLVSHG
jgi:hypothetical protein